MKIPGRGAYISAPALAAVHAAILDFLAEDKYRSDRMPKQYRQELVDAAEVGLECWEPCSRLPMRTRANICLQVSVRHPHHRN